MGNILSCFFKEYFLSVCEKQSFGKILLNWIGKEVMEDENDPRGRTHRDFSREEMIELFE